MTAVEDSDCPVSNQTCICHNKNLNAQATACVTAGCTIRESLFTKNLTSTSCGISPTVDHSYVPVLMAFTAIAAVCVMLRVIARLKAKVPVWWDDFIVVMSFVSRPSFGLLAHFRHTVQMLMILRILAAGLRCIYDSNMVK